MTESLRQGTPVSIPTALRRVGREGIKTLGCIGLWMNSLAPLPPPLLYKQPEGSC